MFVFISISGVTVNVTLLGYSVYFISQSVKVPNGRCQSDDDCMAGEAVVAGHGENHALLYRHANLVTLILSHIRI